jgi:aldose sugar dehydrogenase
MPSRFSFLRPSPSAPGLIPILALTLVGAIHLVLPGANLSGLALPGASTTLTAQTPSGPGTGGNAPVFESEFHDFRVATVAEGLHDPWSMAFLPGGGLLITEKPGRLRIVRNGVLEPDPIPGTPKVRYQGQGGLLEVALHPDFQGNRLLYLSYAKPSPDGSQGTTAVARARFDGERLTELEEIFVAEGWSTAGSHYGGKLAFDPEGHLFITVGDRGASPLAGPRDQHPAQDLTNHQGTVVRLLDDGRVPEDNPFVGQAHALPEIWSYGHRNPQGLDIDLETGDVWSTEHGPQGGDELNLILPGRNYGWPVIGYGVQYGGTPIHEARERDGMEQPFQFWTPSIATSGLLLYTGERFPEWQGHLLVGGLDGRQIARVPIVEGEDGYQPGRLERPGLLMGFGRIRDIRQGPDGFVYIAIDDRRGGGLTPVVRLEPVDR